MGKLALQYMQIFYVSDLNRNCHVIENELNAIQKLCKIVLKIDNVSDLELAEQRFREIAEAYEVLSEPSLKSRYDQTGIVPDDKAKSDAQSKPARGRPGAFRTGTAKKIKRKFQPA